MQGEVERHGVVRGTGLEGWHAAETTDDHTASR